MSDEAATVTWPMVALALVRELPWVTMTVAGCVTCVVLAVRVPTSLIPAVVSAIVPALISGVSKTLRPAESMGETLAKANGRGQ